MHGLCGRGVKIMFQYDGLVVGQRIRNLRVEAGCELGEYHIWIIHLLMDMVSSFFVNSILP